MPQGYIDIPLHPKQRRAVAPSEDIALPGQPVQGPIIGGQVYPMGIDTADLGRPGGPQPVQGPIVGGQVYPMGTDTADIRTPPPPQALAGVGIQTVSNEKWNQMTPAERTAGLFKAAGLVTGQMLGMTPPTAQEAVEHPVATLASAAIPPAMKGARALIPAKAATAAKFQTVMAAAKNTPVNIADPGNVALRIQQLAERGGSMPKVVRDFLRRVTDPDKGPIVYEEARDFYSNISRLSADEYKRLTPVIAREVGNLRAALNRSIEGAARQAGKLPEYQAAIREYARRARVEDFASDVWKDVKRYAVPGGALYYGFRKLSDLVRGEE